MQEFVFFIEGRVQHPLTIDPTVWIFDERKVDLNTYFNEQANKEDADTIYKKAISAQWDKEILEGSAPPRLHTNGNEIKHKKQREITGKYAMPLLPFIENTKPSQTPTFIEVECKEQNVTLQYAQAKKALLGFAKEGKPLHEDGPVHLYYGDGSNAHDPIRHIKKIIIH